MKVEIHSTENLRARGHFKQAAVEPAKPPFLTDIGKLASLENHSGVAQGRALGLDRVGAGASPAPGPFLGGWMLGYVLTQLAHRLNTQQNSSDAAVAERAGRRVEQWRQLLEGIRSGRVEVGSRSPVRGVPAWVTLEVLTGGFASGKLLAAGPLQPHEVELMQSLGASRRGELNAHFLSDAGLARLREMLATGCYQLNLPEEGAWLVLAWLEQHGHLEQAAQLLDTLLPHSGKLRFYPIPREHPAPSDLRVHLRTVSEVRQGLEAMRPNLRVLAQKETVEVWLPLYDQMLSLFQETVQEGWPCRVYPKDWHQRAQQLLETFQRLRQVHRLCGRPDRSKHSFAQLRAFLERGPQSLTGKDIGRLRLILQRSERKRGLPGSERFRQAREAQRQGVVGPTHQELARVLSQRMASLPPDEGVEELEPLGQATPEGYPIPASLLEKVESCLHASLEELVARGQIPSGEVLAQILPQLTSQLRAAEFEDPALGRLFAAIYRAFRARRSLLLLHLRSQVRLEELPWVAALQPFRRQAEPTRQASRQALESLTRAALSAFPQAILPNKLIREMRALAEGAQLKMPFTDELAADIFMGKFAPHFSEAARQAQQFLQGSLYQVYYGIQPGTFENLIGLCLSRAGTSPGSPAKNGRILEQQQILTTHNLAALFENLQLGLDLNKLALDCFVWICRRLQIPQADWHDQILSIKNAAYAWRQLLFFLSLTQPDRFLEEAGAFWQRQPSNFQRRFEPAWQGLLQARQGQAPVQPFLGWTLGRHWLMPARQPEP